MCSANDQRPKRRAQLLAQRAIRQGVLVRPDACSVCGVTGRKIVAHHDDYRRPFAVRWVCERDHRLIHGPARRAERLPVGATA